ncbi:MAG: glucose-1-phosphate adenylyltransferase [Clostridiales bacterium]|jgi:glucose-1-phosphate adenylyltransferase|nr:glucose-1-phosphate adenylyltransferase [Clostridiales bacterium]
MKKKEMIALLLAGGQGSRLGVLTAKKAKPAVSFGGKYRMIDFPMSNCINSGVDTVGVLTQYEPLLLNRHIGIGIAWDLDRRSGGVTILAPHVKGEQGEWYSGTANAIFQNIDYIDAYSPEYVLILSGDHIYKMDYSKMLDFHKKNHCDATIAVREVTMEEAGRFGIMNTREGDSIYEFEEKPKTPKSNLASMGNYIFTWSKLREALIADNKIHNDSDFGKHIIPRMLSENQILFAYRFSDYWKDVGTIETYWAANMDLIKTLPDFNLYDDFWRIYTDSDHQPPQYTGPNSDVRTSLLAEGCEVYGAVYNSVLGPGVFVDEGAVIRDSIIMEDCRIGRNSRLERSIVDEGAQVGADVVIGQGEIIPNEDKPNVYNTGITVVGENSSVPDGVTIGKNCVIYGKTEYSDFESGRLESGKSILHEQEVIQ